MHARHAGRFKHRVNLSSNAKAAHLRTQYKLDVLCWRNLTQGPTKGKPQPGQGTKQMHTTHHTCIVFCKNLPRAEHVMCACRRSVPNNTTRANKHTLLHNNSQVRHPITLIQQLVCTFKMAVGAQPASHTWCTPMHRHNQVKPVTSCVSLLLYTLSHIE